MRYQDVKSYYEDVYGQQSDDAFPFDAERYISWLARIPRLGENSRALDIGCGVGFACELLARHGCEVHGIDISDTALERARARVPAAIFRTSSESGQLDYDDEHFDLVVCLGVLEHIKDPHVVVAETHRVLRRGGIAIFMVPNSLNPYFWVGGTGQVLEVPRRRAEWMRMFEGAGLRVTGVGRDPGPSWRAAYPAKKKVKLALNRVLNRLPIELTYQFIFTLER